MSSTAASTSASKTLTARLGQYAAVAAAIPAAGASGAIVTDSFSSPVVVTNGNPVDINFGATFGEVFRFTFNRYTDFDTNIHTYYGNTIIYRFSSAANALINFNNPYYYNTNAISPPESAYFANFNPANGYFGGNDPVRFAQGQQVSYYGGTGVSWNDFDYYRGTNHDIFRKGFSYSVTNYGNFSYSSSTFGAWRPGQRGYLLFSFFEDGDSYNGFFDIALSANGDSLIINGWAFNNTPDSPITTQPLPAPGAVGLAALPMGAAGVRRQPQALQTAPSRPRAFHRTH